jgi:hypothetical protein
MQAAEQHMIFITGASRSGTTLMSFILRNHSRVFGLKETHYFGEFWDPRRPGKHRGSNRLIHGAAAILARQEQGILAAKPTDRDYQTARELVESLPANEQDPASVFARVTGKLAHDAGKAIPCEQTPRNIFYAGQLLQLYPNARLVHMLRDPRAVMASQKKRWHRRRLSADSSHFPLAHSLRVWINYHPYTAARLWNRASQAAMRLQSHPRFTLVRFEELLTDPDRIVSSLCRDLDIDYEPAMLDVGQINSSHQSSVGGARRGLHRDAIATWKTALSAPEISIAEHQCGQLMEQYGYERIQPESRPRVRELPWALSYLLHLLGVLIVNPKRAWIQFRAMPAFLRRQKPPGTQAAAKVFEPGNRQK